MLTVYPRRIRADATSLFVFQGPANVAVQWSVQSGPGTITPLSTFTDSRGLAAARYNPAGLTGTAVVRVSHGA